MIVVVVAIVNVVCRVGCAKAQLAAHHMGVPDAPVVIAYCAPFAAVQNFHTALKRRAPPHKPHRGIQSYTPLQHKVPLAAVAEARLDVVHRLGRAERVLPAHFCDIRIVNASHKIVSRAAASVPQHVHAVIGVGGL
eukprot:CAMPEP_0118958102 /NCGR_PEP_ID=MMETSP1169-20130426/62451_1 /TAXON_ID=36882 /ORGANISM="Pyramimonas obovata, Strain CCMP722" /LENGTH=135 /DNA_ID=CAMNT_0006906209 /DNA_START=413 /DNA_END=816 /DNA_ORIENTATION=+